MRRYALLRERVAALSGIQLLVPQSVSPERLLRVHDPDYVSRVFGGGLTALEQRRLGFPWSPALLERSLRSVGATCEAAFSVWEAGGFAVAANLAGGTHHAFADRGEGFCLFNDCVVAAQALLEEAGVERIAMVDCDVHQGDGTASLCGNEARIFTLSLHGEKNYPFRKETSDLDLELPDGCEDEHYLQVLERGWQAVAASRPQVVFYLAGADAFGGDRLGRLALTKEGLVRRDRFVLGQCHQAGIGVVVVMAGGYAEPIEDTADIQARTIEVALEFTFRSTEMGQKVGYGRIVRPI